MLRYMRTTIRLDANLMRQLKRLAAESHGTLTTIIEDAVREMLARRQAKVSRKPVNLPTFMGQGLQPGVDLDDSAILLDHIESR